MKLHRLVRSGWAPAVVATALVAGAALIFPSAAGATVTGAVPVRVNPVSAVPVPTARCTGLTGRTIGGAVVDRATADTDERFTVPAGQGGPGELPAGTVLTDLPAFCAVQLTRTNPPANDQIHVAVWLPLNTWNRRFQGVGGGGYVAGISFRNLAAALRAGYAAASTDTGHPAAQSDGSFVLDPARHADPAQVADFGYRAIHEMTEAGQETVRRLYGTPADHSYFSGCSTGGRQALAEAQRYPLDYNGILAGAPAVDFPRLAAAQLWPQVVMLRARDFVPSCKFAAFRAAVTAACDPLDGVTDGVIGDPQACRFDPRGMVGRATPCGTISRRDADVLRQIWQGPSFWYGLEPGSDLSLLAATQTVNGARTGYPLYVADSWFRYWLTRDPSFDWTTLTTGAYARLADRGIRTFPALASDDPDLSAFRAAGGKLVMWAGLADPLIPPQGSIRYYTEVARQSGGLHQAGDFARLFLAPGAGHCGPTGSVGPLPADPLTAVTTWVEHGVAPHRIPARRTTPDGTVETRPLCAYPLVARYTGHGSTHEAANFRCTTIAGG